MPVIHPPTMPSSTPEGLSRTVKTKDSPALLPAASGEVLTAPGGGKTDPANTLYTAYLKLFRGNPEALMEIFQKGPDLFDQQPLNHLLSGTTKNALGNVTRILDSLLSAPKSLTTPLFLKDYAAKLGLRLEGDWSDFARQESGNQRPAESLKSALLKLAVELTGLLQASSTLKPEELQKLTHLAKFTESSLKAIETQQMINVFPQENDNKYLLQIPLPFPGGVRTGEIFIDLGENGHGGEVRKKKIHVLMFLSMDKLGEMAVDASLIDKDIACVFKFTDPEAREFFAPLLEGLGEALRRIGYDTASLTTIVTEDVAGSRQACHRELFQGQDAINLFA